MTDSHFKNLIETGGRVIPTPGNKPFLLEGENNVWIVGTGTVDVFFVNIEKSGKFGKREHLLRAQTGEILFGVKPPEQENPTGLLLVGSQDSSVTHIEKSGLVELSGRFPKETAEHIDRWISEFSSGLTVELPPKSFKPLEPDKDLQLNPEEYTRSLRQVLWVKFTKGSASLLGMDDLYLDPHDGVFPVAGKTWLKSNDKTTAGIRTTTELIENGTIWTGLSLFHRMAMFCLLLNRSRNETYLRERLKAKAEREKLTANQAFIQLSSLLLKRREDFTSIDPDDPLLTACQWVGQAQGIHIRAPEKTNDRSVNKNRLEDITRASGTRTRKVVLNGKWWTHDNGPLLGHIEDSLRPVALLPVSKNRYEMVDPVERTRTPITHETADILSPFAYEFYRPFPGKPLDIISILNLGRIGCRKDIRMVIVLSVLSGLIGLLIPILTGKIFDTIVPESDRTLLLHVFLALITGAVVTMLFEVTKSMAMLRIECKMNASVQAAIWDRLLNLPLPFFRKYTAGDLALRAGAINTIRQAISGAAASVFISGIFSLFYMGLLFYYDAKLAVVAAGFGLMAFLFTTVISILSLNRQREIRKMEGKISGMVLQFINGISKLRVAGAEVHAFATWAAAFAKKKKAAFKTGSLMNRLETFNAVLPVAASMSIFFSVTYLMKESAETGEPLMTIGSFLAFNTAFTTFLTAALEMSVTIISILNIIPEYERAKPILEALPEVVDQQNDPGELKGEVEVNHVEFRYREDLPLVLKDVSIQLKPGEFGAVVGSSGSGKSTLLRLLLGFEKPESGSIYYDGQYMGDLDLREVRRQIGVVLQSSRLMSGDIFRNIVGSSNLTMDDAWTAAKMAGFDKDVEQMPMKMHTVISEGGQTLSGGQRQRLLIARAMVNRPRIVFFDEATSALDNQTQALVSKSLENLQATRLVIAHRLSTIINADKIFVMHAGKIVETGNYKDLMEKNGHFAELAKRQLA